VLVAAILAFPAPWKRTLVGLAIGIVAVQALNIIRVISLSLSVNGASTLSDFAHQYVWQALIMLDVLIVWLLWVRTLPRAAPAPGCRLSDLARSGRSPAGLSSGRRHGCRWHSCGGISPDRPWRGRSRSLTAGVARLGFAS